MTGLQEKRFDGSCVGASVTFRKRKKKRKRRRRRRRRRPHGRIQRNSEHIKSKRVVRGR